MTVTKAGTQVVEVRTQHTAFRGTSVIFFSSWHLPKVLIRKSAIRAWSGASTLKDQYLGQVPGGEKKGGGRAISKKTRHFGAQLLERSKRAQKIGEVCAQHLCNSNAAGGKASNNTVHSSVGRASDCRPKQMSDGPWFDSV